MFFVSQYLKLFGAHATSNVSIYRYIYIYKIRANLRPPCQRQSGKSVTKKIDNPKILDTWFFCFSIFSAVQFSRNLKFFYIQVSLLYSSTMCVCLWPISSGTAGPIWLNFFLLAPSWSREGFRPKKFRIRDPVFPEIRKKPDFRVLFDQFG